uniref:Uncharacterized protein n=1 Tax=Arundo donax TaxID=35708 RepID=A0A0A9BU62_ARUDO
MKLCKTRITVTQRQRAVYQMNQFLRGESQPGTSPSLQKKILTPAACEGG